MGLFDPISPGPILSVMPTFQCNASCASCGTFSNPENKVRLAHDLAEESIREAAGLGYRVVVFTGGEPTLAGNWLFRAIALAKQLGLSTRIVTNGWWARTPERAAAKMKKFIEAGLDEINFSTGDQHARFVPVDSVLRGVRAAVANGLRTAIMVELIQERRITGASLEARADFIALRADFPYAEIMVHESPWMPLSPDEFEQYPDGTAVNSGNIAACTGCDSILTTTTVESDGTIGACCGIGMRLVPELQLGNVTNTSLADATRTANSDFLKRWIRAEGPERILEWAASFDQSIEWENMYAHRCQACVRLYQDPRVRDVIFEHHAEKIAEVEFETWLLTRYAGARSSAGSTHDRKL